MSAIAVESPSHRFSVPVHWGRALNAGIVATIVMTIIGAIIGMNFPRMIGGMILPGGSVAMQYAVGGLMHFMIGVVYGFVYAILVGRIVEWNRLTKAIVYGLAITAIAFASMPLMSAMMGGGSKMPPANPCHHAAPMAMNACHPSTGAAAPQQQAAGASNPCNPGSGAGGAWSGVMSVINHLVYALALAFTYGKAR